MASVAGTHEIFHVIDRRSVVIRGWLVVVAALIVAMVVVGGATRLTHSGLSITEWQPIVGVVPPLDQAAWQEAFTKYQQTPEFRAINPDMTLAQFKGIFWWEWSHRMLGRLIGVVVLLPLIAFWVGGWIGRALLPKFIAIFLLGGLQGAVGWWMVASGLTERTDVSQYRLTIHLTLACAILAYVVWVAGSLAQTFGARAVRAVRVVAAAIVALTFVQIFLGGLVAGLDAGLTFNTWPLMDGALIPFNLFTQSPLWLNVFENVGVVQFDHRIGAYVLLAVAVAHAVQARGSPAAPGAYVLAGLIVAQAALGVAALVAVVPFGLALAHQFGAVVVLWAAVAHLRGTVPAPASNKIMLAKG